MALIVGNLLTDPSANSFISLSDADEFLTLEGALAGDQSDMGKWFLLDNERKASSLVIASRWMAANLPWGRQGVTEAQLVHVGYVAARMAVIAAQSDLWASEAIGKQAKRYKAGSVEVEYQDAGSVRGAKAGGKAFPWVYPMLRGMLATPGQHDVVRR